MQGNPRKLRAARPTASCIRSLLLLVILALPALAWCQIRQFRFGRLAVEDGLSSLRAYDIVQDSVGFLWIGTIEGLNRYDGNKIEVYRHSDLDSMSISHNSVRSLLVDRAGTLWAGTSDGGLNRFDRIRDRFTRYVSDPGNPQTISRGLIGALYQDRSGIIWIGSRGGGLNKLVLLKQASAANGATSSEPIFLHYRHDPADSTSISDDRVYSILEDSEGMLWVGTAHGLNMFDKKTEKFTRYYNEPNNPRSLSSDFVVRIYEDRNAILWFGTDRGGLNRFDRSTNSFARYRHDPRKPESLGFDDVYALYQDDEGFLWIGTLMGLDRLDVRTAKFAHFRNDPVDPYSLSNDYIRAIRSDRAGNMWIVTDGGLSKLTRRAREFKYFRYDGDPSAPQSVVGLTESMSSFLWMGTWGDGVRRLELKSNRVTHYKPNPANPSSLNSGFIQAIFEDSRLNIWIGTIEGGLHKYEPRTNQFRRYDWTRGAQNNPVMSICEDAEGALWVGTLTGGLLRFDPSSGRFEQFLSNPADTASLGNNNVQVVKTDTRGVLWIGTEGGGLDELVPTSSGLHATPVQFRHHRHKNADPRTISNDRVYAVCETRNGNLWISTGNGLNSYNRKSNEFSFALSLDSLGSGTIMEIVEDQKGVLWLGTAQKGIIKFDPADRTLRNYIADDGLQGNQFFHSSWKRPNGEIVFGGANGYNVFHPDSIFDNPHVPRIVMTSFDIFGKSAPLDSTIAEIKNLRLNYNQNFFSFEFAALDFTVPRKNQFAHKLEGLDTGWNSSQNRRFASYTNVDPGDYVLRVVGSNSDGVWNNVGLSIPLTITPPYWATWWFRSSMMLLFITILTGAYQYRVSKLLEMEHMRVRIASDLHDDIGSSLSSIALITDMVRNHLPPEQKDRQHLADASHAARHTADALKDIVWIINPENEKLDDIVLRMKDSAAKLLVGIEYSFNCTQAAMKGLLDMEFRRNVLLIYKEALNNIAKYSRASKVVITIGGQDGRLHLALTDNGVGFDESTIVRGNGLKNIRMRAENIGGNVEIRSYPGTGTTIELDVEIP